MRYNCDKNMELCIRQITEIVDNMDQIRKAAFYSDPKIEPLVEDLHERWKENDYKGEPLHYAKPKELELLLDLAKHYATIPLWQAYKIFMERSG